MSKNRRRRQASTGTSWAAVRAAEHDRAERMAIPADAAEAWEFMLAHESVNATVRQFVRGPAARLYRARRDPLGLDDVESWAWEELASIASKHAPRFAGDSLQSWLAFAYGALRQSLPTHLGQWAGDTRSGRRKYHDMVASGAIFPVYLDSAEPDNTADFGERTLFAHGVHADDPLRILCRAETLEEAVRAPNVGPYATETIACIDCGQPAKIKGRCDQCFRRWWKHWGRRCEVDGCQVASHTSGLCVRHYRQALDDDPTRPRCIQDGCGRAQHMRSGYCASHHQIRRRNRMPTPTIVAPEPPRICLVDGCETPVGRSGAKGMCSRHYGQYRRGTLAAA